jgi:hypothetical protein
MERHELLRGLHEVLAPRSYFEIGVRDGLSLALSRTRTVGVDPFYRVTSEVRCDVHLVRASSDEFFIRDRPFEHFDEPLVDLAFIDGMHLSEFALRDFINTEKFCGPCSVVVFDDMLPRNQLEARRRRASAAWAGDVYKVGDTLRGLRPDLVALEIDTTPTGTLVVINTDPSNRVLDAAYDHLVVEYVAPDPQVVPEPILTRRRAMKGDDLLSSPVWRDICGLRTRPPAEAGPAVSEAYRRAGFVNPEHP